MSILDEIRKQPEEVKDVMFFLSVFITVLAVGLVWFNSFQKNIYAIMNPEEAQQRALAAESYPSLFGYVGQSFGELSAFVSGFFKDENADPQEDVPTTPAPSVESGQVYRLPLSDYK